MPRVAIFFPTPKRIHNPLFSGSKIFIYICWVNHHNSFPNFFTLREHPPWLLQCMCKNVLQIVNSRYFMLYLYLSMVPISMPIIPYRHPMSAYLSILAFSINQPIYLYCINQIIQLILFLSFSISFCMCISEILIQVSVWVQRYFTNLQLLEQGHLFFFSNLFSG